MATFRVGTDTIGYSLKIGLLTYVFTMLYRFIQTMHFSFNLTQLLVMLVIVSIAYHVVMNYWQ